MKRRSALRWLPALAAWIALFVPAGFLAAQPAPKAAEPQFPIASRLGLAPPPGMTLSTSFQGFEDTKNNVFIRLVAMPDVAYAEIEKSMTNQAFKKQNITVERREAFALPGSKGLLIVARQDAEKVKLRKWLLIAPVGGLTALVSLEIPVAAKNVYSEAAIRASFMTLAARATVPAEEQLTLVPFNLRDLAGFRVAGVMPGRAVQLTETGKDPSETIDHATMLINIGPGGPSSASDRDSFARLAFSVPPTIKDMQILSSEQMRVGGQPGHQVRATGKDTKSGAEIEIVQWLRFGSGAYVRMIGLAPKDDWLSAFSRFRAVRDGLEPR